MSTTRACVLAFIAAALLAMGLVAARAGGADQQPLPFGADPSTWQDSQGRPIVELMPQRVGVATLDGGILRDSAGNPVTVPFGAVARGDVSSDAADAETDAALKRQRLDACQRGLQVPLGVEASGTGLTAEQAAAKSEAALKAAIAANGGMSTRSACGR